MPKTKKTKKTSLKNKLKSFAHAIKRGFTDWKVDTASDAYDVYKAEKKARRKKQLKHGGTLHQHD